MSNFDYDQSGYQVSLDDDDRSKNAPQVLAGYPIDLQPQADWPGMSSAAGGFRLDPAAARSVADWLDQQAVVLREVPGQLLAGTHGVRYGPATWSEANHLSTASDQVSAAVVDYGHDMIANLTLAAEAIRTAVGEYAGADKVNQGSSDSLQSQVSADVPVRARSGRHAAEPGATR